MVSNAVLTMGEPVLVWRIRRGSGRRGVNVHAAELLHKKADQAGAAVAPLSEEFSQSDPEVAAVAQFGYAGAVR